MSGVGGDFQTLSYGSETFNTISEGWVEMFEEDFEEMCGKKFTLILMGSQATLSDVHRHRGAKNQIGLSEAKTESYFFSLGNNKHDPHPNLCTYIIFYFIVISHVIALSFVEINVNQSNLCT